jgi:hypothetical protein
MSEEKKLYTSDDIIIDATEGAYAEAIIDMMKSFGSDPFDVGYLEEKIDKMLCSRLPVDWIFEIDTEFFEGGVLLEIIIKKTVVVENVKLKTITL